MRPAIKIALIYTFVGIIWIMISDKLLISNGSLIDAETVTTLQSLKGIFYVLLTGLLLYFLVGKYYKVLTQQLHEQKRLNQQLRIQSKKLEQSNAELEQFAYVISHDLQEPLRMITLFVSKIKEQYGQVLDEKANKYFEFAIGGGKRMR
jgi:signal transduction histidine kinase